MNNYMTVDITYPLSYERQQLPIIVYTNRFNIAQIDIEISLSVNTATSVLHAKSQSYHIIYILNGVMTHTTS
ncbi:MAG: hypothetical protein J07HQW1_01533 [Haloquadratum walsbyi J07HQW1]|uniref:Uncharacterized protein n=1 Tax=Haloquadratum walsbyi J07HQW1 TaxID=1238424 RepID=U1MNQ9_9EURY|nr:MAG: hypothetical protein J07HQW1_01533 [Haloquadratum walsbyi J07HQW1]